MLSQRFLVDRLSGALYLAGALLVQGCASGRLAVVLPTGMAPAATAEAGRWVGTTRPVSNRLVRFRFQFRDDRGAAGGRGSIRVTPGDSLRFDVIGSLGSFRGAAVVFGDSSVWAEPEEDVSKMVPNYPLLWAMLGIARHPAQGATIRRFEDPRVLAWQFASGADTVEYVRSGAPAGKLIADVRQAGRMIGRVETVFGLDGTAISSRLTVPSVPARLDLSFTSTDTQATFEPDIWAPPPPP